MGLHKEYGVLRGGRRTYYPCMELACFRIKHMGCMCQERLFKFTESLASWFLMFEIIVLYCWLLLEAHESVKTLYRWLEGRLH